MKKIALLALLSVAITPLYGMQKGFKNPPSAFLLATLKVANQEQNVKSSTKNLNQKPAQTLSSGIALIKANKSITAPITLPAPLISIAPATPATTKKSKRYFMQYGPLPQPIKENTLPIHDLEKVIDYTFKKRRRLNKALTTQLANPLKNYENYEFLGDSILHLALTEILLKKKFPNTTPGTLTWSRVALEENGILVLLAKKLELAKYIQLAPDEEIDDVILADVIEALIGAIYKDGGPLAAQQFIDRFWQPMIAGKTDFPVRPDAIITMWENDKKTAAEVKFFNIKSKNRLHAKKMYKLSKYKSALEFVQSLPTEYQQLLPILPLDPNYVLLSQKASIEPSTCFTTKLLETFIRYF